MREGTEMRKLVLLLATAFSMAPVLPALADYVAQRGDVLEVTISSTPALNRRLLVGSDGKIVFPFLGEIDAANAPLSELRRRLQELLVAGNVVRRPDVMVSVAEYGPIYVDGDVQKPGGYSYRPEMTVRSAIALAGGLDSPSGRTRPAPAQLAEARGDYGAAAIELARQRARVARLKSELSGADAFEPPDLADISLDGNVLTEILSIEQRQLNADREAQVREKEYLQRMIAASHDQLIALVQAESQQDSNVEQQTHDASRAHDLLRKGVGTMVRMEGSERAVAEARTQLIEVRVRLAQAREEVEERARNLETFDDQRRTKLLGALRDAVAEAGKVRFRLEAAQERMTGRIDTPQPAGAAGAFQATVRRIVNGVTVSLTVDSDAALQSSDRIEVVAASASRATPALARRSEIE
jgi:polysaccharide biosynthesis/export protein